MSWQCPTCGAWRSCWDPAIYSIPVGQKIRDVALEAASQGLVHALAALAETIPGPGGTRPLHPITYFEGSPTKDEECFNRWKDLNDSIGLVKRILESNRGNDPQESNRNDS